MVGSKPVHPCYGYLVWKTDGGLIEAVIEWRKRFVVQIGILWGVDMSEFMILVIVFISMLVLFYFLWVNGYMILNAKRALLFVGSLRGKNKCEVSFSSCSGYVKKVIKFNESR